MQVLRTISENDAMFVRGRQDHYFAVGKSALSIITAVLELASAEIPRAILDFGCGAGRVTRWLRAAYADAQLSACDLREADLAFVRQWFRAETWLSGADVDALEKHGTFDLIWVGSVMTHLDAIDSEDLLRRLFGWLRPNGLLITSLHGHRARQYGDSGKIHYLASGWTEVTRQYDALGYGYSDYPGQRGYGISLSSPGWAFAAVERLGLARVILYGEALWDNHHDILAVQSPA